MSNENDSGGKKLTLGKGKLELSKRVEAGQVRQSFSHGRSKSVQVEVKRKRTFDRGPQQGGPGGAQAADIGPMKRPEGEKAESAAARRAAEQAAANPALKGLSEQERAARLRAIQSAQAEEERRRREAEEAEQRAEERRRQREAEEAERKAREEEEARRAAEEAARAEQEKAESAAKPAVEAEAKDAEPEEVAQPSPADIEAEAQAAAKSSEQKSGREKADELIEREQKKRPTMRLKGGEKRRQGKLSIYQVGDEGDPDSEARRGRSMAALQRQRQREREKNRQALARGEKVVRDVTIPEAVTVGDLANRMAVRAADVIKALMKMGVMATVNQTIDQDTAELVVEEFGHRARRVSEADVEDSLIEEDAQEEAQVARAPVVTIMGHVDHGKTSLLDALRETDVAGGEAGGITQHIGAYQVTLKGGDTITFLDTPGHEAFTAMRNRGAQVTDIVVLVVAADDGLQPQTIEAINHAKAAEVPIIVAINKIDKDGADPTKATNQLLEHELVPESMGGDIQVIEVSALKRMGLEALEEAILLQSELLELKADPGRTARGAVVEAKLEKGRGSVASVLVQTGTLRVGDIFVAGAEWGRVRALLDDKGRQVEAAGPSVPVEVLGLQGTPQAGDEFVVLNDEAKAREISEYRQRKQREAHFAVSGRAGRSSLEQMFDQIKAGEVEQMPVVVKADVQGSLEAINASLEKLATDEVKVRVVHGAVGGITESDVGLAASTGGVIIGFNVRANPQAREMAKRDGIDIRYYSIIYDVIDDVKAVLSGMLAPERRENFLGYAEIRDVFQITKAGKVAGCMVTEGTVKRGAKVRLLRDDTVIHEGSLKTLKRFKDDVREVQHGYECGMAFENYDNIKVGDMIECFEIEEVARAL
ncbi:translation initiation factor IF-2 [Marivibrio halodurans]|uniref:Translation initiation factor IF-2 n=1 Tax=Marivibrio halodurans TaxID=2039722 RepID=A0A8J7S1N3_9PROT|nr:translation initiation factor IF-2 [Marivibrio halodurans]MBP5858707.1 translation initiation factor IF-2 [Marivibrio halodurans]